MPSLAVLVAGYVQGVGYRDFVRRSARVFAIRGEVWNRTDGAVEMILVHEDEHHLDAFVKLLPQGPGRVESVDVEPAESQEFETFTIGPTR